MISASCTIRGNIQDGVNRLRNLNQQTEDTAEQFVRSSSYHAAERAELNAPILTSRLRLELRPLQIQRLAGLRRIVGGVVSPTPWAFKMHEFQMCFSVPTAVPGLNRPPRAYPPIGRQLRHGPITQQQPQTPEGGPGGKFIERVLAFHSADYKRLLAQMLREMLVTGKVPIHQEV